MPQASYCYVRVVGRGSYGEVTLVKHRQDGKQVGGWGSRQGRGGEGVRRGQPQKQEVPSGQGTHLPFEVSFPILPPQ